MFRPLQGHHQGHIYKVIQVQQVLPETYVCSYIMYCQLKLLMFKMEIC